MTELPLFSHDVDKIPPSAELLKKMAVAATVAANHEKSLRVVRKGFSDRYLWHEQSENTDERFVRRTGKFKPECLALVLDQETQTETFMGMTGEYRFRMRDLRCERDMELGTPWIGQLSTYAFDWSEDGGVTKNELEIKSVPSMTEDEAQQLESFYRNQSPEDYFDDMTFEETLVQTDSVKIPLYAEHCARLLAEFRRSMRAA